MAKDPRRPTSDRDAIDSAPDPTLSTRAPGPGVDDEPQGRKGTGFLAVLQSVAAAGIGVQSSRNRQRDFERGKPIHFIIGGLIGTLVFLLAVYLFVRVLLATA